MKKLLTFLLLTHLTTAFAIKDYRTQFLALYPHTKGMKLSSCKLCHDSPGYHNINAFGDDFTTYGYDYKAIENLDSDGDTVSNIDEINNLTHPAKASEAFTELDYDFE